MTDWGAHHNDIALWGLGLERSGPVTIEGKPLVEMIPGGYTASAEYRVAYTYANGVAHTCQSTSGNGPDGSVRGTPKPGELPRIPDATDEGTLDLPPDDLPEAGSLPRSVKK